MRILRLSEMNSKVENLNSQIDEICLEASGKTFSNPEEKRQFCENWLKLYRVHFAHFFYIAVTKKHSDYEECMAYLCICPDSAKWADQFKHQAYYALFQNSYMDYPAHLHINTSKNYRNQGIGAKLIEFACQDLKSKGISGLHLITAEKAQNTNFYKKNAFALIESQNFNGNTLVLLGKKI